MCKSIQQERALNDCMCSTTKAKSYDFNKKMIPVIHLTQTYNLGTTGAGSQLVSSITCIAQTNPANIANFSRSFQLWSI